MLNMDEVCKDMKLHLHLHTQQHTSMHEQVHTMSELQRQVMDGTAFNLKHEKALIASGYDPEQDAALL